MPEGDTIWRSARRLHAALAGDPLRLCDIRWGQADGAPLLGRTTLEVVSRGKHLLHRVEGGATLHSHLRMDGSWRIAAAGSPDAARALRRQDLRAAVGGERWSAFGLRLGMCELLPTAEESRVVGHLGPDVLGADWDLERVLGNLAAVADARPELPVVTALLDQRNLAGVGTFWASEMLFVERVHPWQALAAIDPERRRQLVVRVAGMMDRGKEHAIQSSTGILRMGEDAFVHGRSGKPCRRCSGTLRVALAGEAPQARTIFYCPACQGGLAPTDDGRSQAPLGARRDPRRYRDSPGYRRGR